MSLFVTQGFVEPSCHGWRHPIQISLVDSPVQPAQFYSFFSAFADHLQQRLYRLDTLRMVTEDRMNEEILHINNHQQRLLWIDLHASVITNTVVSVDS